MVYTYSAKLLATARLYTKTKEDGEDVLQDAFVMMFQKIKQFNGHTEGELYSWIKRIVINTAINKYKIKYYSQEMYVEYPNDVSEEPTIDAKLAVEDVIALSYNMPVGLRQVFSLYILESHNHKEIAERLGIKESTSRSQYTRAKRWIIQALENQNKPLSNSINLRS